MADVKDKFKKNTLKNEEQTNTETEKPEKKKNNPKVKSKKTTVKVEAAPERFAFLKDERFHKVMGLFFLLASVYLFLAFTSYLISWKTDDNIFSRSFTSFLFDNSVIPENWMGRMGSFLAWIFIKKWFGIASFLFVLVFLVTGLKLLLNIRLLPIGLTYKYSFFAIIWISVALGFTFRAPYLILGGIFGYQSNIFLKGILGKAGTGLLLIFAFLSFLIIAYRFSFKWFRKVKQEMKQENPEEETEETENVEQNIFQKNSIIENIIEEKNETAETVIEFDLNKKKIKEEAPNKEPIIENNISNKKNEIEEIANPEVEFTVEKPAEIIEESDIEKIAEKLVKEKGTFDPTLDLRDFKLPSIDLLDDYEISSVGVQKEELEANKNRIVSTLNNYAIQIDKIKATIGPTVTLYEIIPAAGVRISKIKNLEDDIALSLSALGIRIIAPIPGKGTIGIEVPNQRPEIVPMKAILSSDKFLNNNFELPIGIGKTIANESFVADLTKMPHLLVAGATGQGKSVGLNAILTSLLFKKHPAQLKFVLIDPKRVELTLYSKIERHYLAKLPDVENAIITDTKQVVRTLNSLCLEMDARLDLMHDARVRNIKEYNEKFIGRKLNPEEGHRFLPYIVLVVDEFADLIITAGREVETPITRLAQLARAIGIHLIIATQRPSVNIITGTIKANFPARLAFRVISKIDSRTILDTGGADQLIGRGDMLLSTGSDLIRLQCAFVDTHEVERITEFIGSQRGYPNAFSLPEFNEENGEEPNKNMDPSERDELFEEAAHIIVSHQQGSTSLLQRKLKLGYNRAGRIVDQLEAVGIIGPFEGSKAREVKIKDLEHLEQFLKCL
ncbi:MAG TPA: DNA translocase FtsK [Bacteroidales bacterium]|nr:DNA translocase FtsK [Bacteroidales bacterium]HPS17886.1 DNA translocase FtsK [Bacteroidales bacterium]